MKELMRDLVPFIGDLLQQDCSETYFSIIVWCDCDENPKFVGGNDGSTPRTLKMLKRAGDVILANMESVEGHA